jgi:enoyl-CoA hydratase/carnithine racemase
MSAYEHLRYEIPADHVVRIVLDRPDAANALSPALFAELDDAVSRVAHDDDVRAWILTGAPRSDGRPWFSAGADLKAALEPQEPRHRLVDPARLIDRIDAMLKPSIAAIGGFCTTGALELVLACDLRIAATSARLSDWHLKVTGLGIGQWGSAVRLARLVGTDRAKELLLTGRELTGAEAEAIGLVHRSVPDESLDEAAIEMAATIAGMPRRGVRTTMGFLAIQEGQSKHEALRWAQLTPDLMGLELRPLRDAADRIDQRER